MWLFDTARYGRSFVGAAVLLSLFACKRKQPRTTEEVVAAAKAIRPASNWPMKVAPIAPVAAAAPDALAEDTGLSVQEVTDRTSSDTLAAWPLKTAEWDSLNAY